MRKQKLKGIANPVRKIIFLGGFLILIVTACGTSKATGNIPGSQEVQTLLNSQEWEIENEWAMPLSANMINLIGNPNYIRKKGDSLDIFLPYFGVRHSGGGYGGEGGIIFKGLAKNFNINYNEKRDNYMITFEGNHNTENLRFIITVYPNRETNTSVTTSERSTISYRGKLRPLKEEE